MIFSATVPDFIQSLSLKYMKNPLLIDLVGDSENQIPEGITHRAIITSNFQSKMRQVENYLKENKDAKVIIFSETKSEASSFEKKDWARFFVIHGDVQQSTREKRLDMFRNAKSGVLVATDVAARGLDVEDVDAVIQLSCRHLDSFVHRSGRTGRKGKDGKNFLFFDESDYQFVLRLEKKLKLGMEITGNISQNTLTAEE